MLMWMNIVTASFCSCIIEFERLVPSWQAGMEVDVEMAMVIDMEMAMAIAIDMEMVIVIDMEMVMGMVTELR